MNRTGGSLTLLAMVFLAACGSGGVSPGYSAPRARVPASGAAP